MPCSSHKHKKKGDCPSCSVCRCCPAPPGCVRSYEHIALGARGKKRQPRKGDVGWEARPAIGQGDRRRARETGHNAEGAAREALIWAMSRKGEDDNDGVMRVYGSGVVVGDGNATAAAEKDPLKVDALASKPTPSRSRRGRPQRAAAKKPPPEDIGAKSCPPKRKRGRPRKAENDVDTKSPPKKKRGRPRKVKAPEEDTGKGATRRGKSKPKLPSLPDTLRERVEARNDEEEEGVDSSAQSYGGGGEEKNDEVKASTKKPRRRSPKIADPEQLPLSTIAATAKAKDKLYAICALLGLPSAPVDKMPQGGFDPKVFSAGDLSRRRAKKVYLTILGAIENLICPEHPSIVREDILGVKDTKHARTKATAATADASPSCKDARKLESSKEKLVEHTVRLALVGSNDPATVAASLLAGSYRQADLRKMLNKASVGGAVKRVEKFDRKVRRSRGDLDEFEIDTAGDAGPVNAEVAGIDTAPAVDSAPRDKGGDTIDVKPPLPADSKATQDAAEPAVGLGDIEGRPEPPSEQEEIPVPSRRRNCGDLRFSTLRKTHALLQTGEPIPQRTYAYRVNPDCIRTAVAFLQQRLSVPRPDVLRRIVVGVHDLGSVPACERGTTSMDQLFGEYRAACEATGMAGMRVGLPTFAEVVGLLTGMPRGNTNTGRRLGTERQSSGRETTQQVGMTIGV